MDQIEPKKVSFSYTEADFIRGVRQWYFITFRRTLKLVVGALVILNVIEGLFFIAEPEKHKHLVIELLSGFFVGVLIASIVLLVCCPLSLWRAKKNYRRSPELYQDINWEVSNEGLCILRGENRTMLPWKLFKKLHFSKDFLIIERKDLSIAHLCPRTVFSDRGKLWYDALSEKIRQNKA